MASKVNLGNTANMLKNTVENINSAESRENFKLRDIPVEQIKFNEGNFYDATKVEELKQDIELNGLYHNLMVEKVSDSEYTLLSGERRLRAIKQLIEEGSDCPIAKSKKVPCKIVENVDEIDQKIMLIRANATARELTTDEKMKQVDMIEELLELKQKMGGKVEGKKRDNVAKLGNMSGRQYDRVKQLKNLIPEIYEMVKDGKLAESAAVKFASMSKKDQQAVYQVLVNEGDKVTRDRASEIKSDFDKELKKKDDEIKRLKDENKKLSTDNQKLLQDLSETEKDMSKAINAQKSLESTLMKKEGEIETVQGKLDEELKKSNPDKKHVKELEDNLEKLSQEKQGIDGKLDEYKGEIDRLTNDKKELEKKIKEMEKGKAEKVNPAIEKNQEISVKLAILKNQLDTVITDMGSVKGLKDGFLTDRNKKAFNEIKKVIENNIDSLMAD